MAEGKKIDGESLSNLRKEVVRLRNENRRLAENQPHRCAVYDRQKGIVTERCENLRSSGTFFRCGKHGCAVGFSDFCSLYRRERKLS